MLLCGTTGKMETFWLDAEANVALTDKSMTEVRGFSTTAVHCGLLSELS